MGVIGFAAARDHSIKKDTLPDSQALLRFDSGRAISLADSQRHTGVFGASGIGKSTNTCEPALEAAIAKIPTLLVFDPKGTLTGKVISLAKKYGRSKDVIIIGTSPATQPINILNGLTSSQFYNFVMEIFRRFTDGGKSGNMDFHASAMSTARDIYTVLKGVADIFHARPAGSPFSQPCQTAPTLPLVLDLLNDCKTATYIFQQYQKIAKMTPQLRRFVRRIQNSLFHALNQTKEEDDIDNDHEQQVAYHTGGAIRALSEFLDEEGIIEKFCHPGAPGLDFSRCEGKIILISFGAGAGGAAASVCRLVIESFYNWVYRQGVGGRPKIIIADEYQEYADLGSRRLADPAFLALAREFLCSVFLISQSYSGLAAKHGTAGLDALVANLNNKIFLHSEDPQTREAARALGSPDLIELQKECFAATYDTRSREYVYGLETLNNAYAISCAIPKAEIEAFDQEASEHPIDDIVAALDWLLAEEKRKYQNTMRKAAGEAKDEDKDNRTQTPEQASELYASAGIKKNESYDEAVAESPDFQPFLSEDETSLKKAPEPDPEDLRFLYSEFFQKDADVRVPRGFLSFVAQALDIMGNLGLTPRLSRLAFSHSKTGLFEASGQPSGEILYLNRLLTSTRNICAKCGAEIKRNSFNLCDSCAGNFQNRRLRDPEQKRGHSMPKRFSPAPLAQTAMSSTKARADRV